jgi:uncharacterized tellurite resistance protein B-like protein
MNIKIFIVTLLASFAAQAGDWTDMLADLMQQPDTRIEFVQSMRDLIKADGYVCYAPRHIRSVDSALYVVECDHEADGATSLYSVSATPMGNGLVWHATPRQS